jgi:hypothetical protein
MPTDSALIQSRIGTTAPVVVMSAIFVLRPLSEFQAHLDKSTNYLGPLERRGLSVGLEKVRIIERGRMWSALAVTVSFVSIVEK